MYVQIHKKQSYHKQHRVYIVMMANKRQRKNKLKKTIQFWFCVVVVTIFFALLAHRQKKLFFRFWLCAFLVVGDSCGGIYFCSFALVVVVVISLFRSSLFFILFLLHNIQCYRMLYDCHIHTFTIHGKLLGIAILCVLVRFSLLHVNV